MSEHPMPTNESPESAKGSVGSEDSGKADLDVVAGQLDAETLKQQRQEHQARGAGLDGSSSDGDTGPKGA